MRDGGGGGGGKMSKVEFLNPCNSLNLVTCLA
jgi:hypothetical protein